MALGTEHGAVLRTTGTPQCLFAMRWNLVGCHGSSSSESCLTLAEMRPSTKSNILFLLVVSDAMRFRDLQHIPARNSRPLVWCALPPLNLWIAY